MAKVCVFLADGFEEVEGLTVVDLLRRAGQDVEMVSVMGKLEITGSHGIRVMADTLFEDIDFSEKELLVLPGGLPGTTNLGGYEPLIDLLKEWNEKKKLIAAICAAPSIFGDLGFVNGKVAVSYPSFESRLAGAVIGEGSVAIDEHIITSRGLGTAIDFSLALIGRLCGEEKAEEIKKSVIYGLF